MQHVETEVAGLLQRALQDLARKHKNQWFTHSDIARQLNVASGRLNDTRKEVLERLAAMGKVEFRYRPNDARKTHEYRPRGRTIPSSSEAVFLEDNFYTALFAYLNRSLPAEDQPPQYMQYVPNDLSAAGWLDEARELAVRLKKQHHIDRRHEVDQVVVWINGKEFQKAYQYLVERKQAVKSMIAGMDA